MESPLLDFYQDKIAEALAMQNECVFKQDGNEWMCVHRDFKSIDLPENDYYAFGTTKTIAIKKYIKERNI